MIPAGANDNSWARRTPSGLRQLYRKAKMGLKNRLLQTTMRLVRAEESQTRHLSLATKQLYLTYHPDSHSLFSAHPEFNRLLDKFTAHNRANNGGDIVRLWSFILNLKQVLGEGIEGHFAELGVWRGNTAAILAYYARENKRKVYLFDTYEGFSQEDLVGVDAGKKLEFSQAIGALEALAATLAAISLPEFSIDCAVSFSWATIAWVAAICAESSEAFIFPSAESSVATSFMTEE